MSAIKRLLRRPEDTQAFAAALAETLQVGDVITLSGEVGVGKTTFAQGLIHALLEIPEAITSPTFTIMQHYRTRHGWPLLHMDLYRLQHKEALVELGLEEHFPTHATLIEWPEIAGDLLPEDVLHITLAYVDEQCREMTLYSTSPRWQNILNNLGN